MRNKKEYKPDDRITQIMLMNNYGLPYGFIKKHLPEPKRHEYNYPGKLNNYTLLYRISDIKVALGTLESRKELRELFTRRARKELRENNNDQSEKWIEAEAKKIAWEKMVSFKKQIEIDIDTRMGWDGKTDEDYLYEATLVMSGYKIADWLGISYINDNQSLLLLLQLMSAESEAETLDVMQYVLFPKANKKYSETLMKDMESIRLKLLELYENTPSYSESFDLEE